VNRTRWIGAAALLIVALAALWYVASPWYTLREMKAAARAGDSDAFASYVDFPALRKDLKAELRTRLRARSRSEGGGLAGLALALGSALADPVIDGLVSPGGVRAAFIARREEAEAAGAPAARSALRLPDRPEVHRRGLSEFVVTGKGEARSGLVFVRHGLGWKLSGVDLPPEQGVPGG
jgi:hypothetical protein